MYESPSTIPRKAATVIGSGPRRPQELVLWTEVETTSAPVPSTTSARPGPSGTGKYARMPPLSFMLRTQIERVLGRNR